MKKIILLASVLISFAATKKDRVNPPMGTYLRKADMLAGTIDGLKTLHPKDSMICDLQGRYAYKDGGEARFIFVANSLAAANDRDIIAPNGGTGRWVLQVVNHAVSLKQLGIFPKADNTVAINAAIDWAAANRYDLHIPAGSTYMVDPAAGGIAAADGMNIIGDDSATSIIKAKAYAGHGKYMIKYHNPGRPVNDITIKNIKFIGNQSFANHVFSSDNVNADSASRILSFFPVINLTVERCVFMDGGTNGAIYFYNSKNVLIKNNSCDSIGGMFITTVYSQGDSNVQVTGNKGRGWGYRDRYDGGAPAGIAKRRSGDDWIEAGGSQWHINNNECWNKSKTRWFWIEARLHGYNEMLGNRLHGEGMNCLGISTGKDQLAGAPLPVGNKIQDNYQDSMPFDKSTAADSVGGLPKYTNSNYIELFGSRDLDVSKNTFMNVHFGKQQSSKNTSIHDNNIDCSGFDAGPGYYSGYNFLFSLGACCTGDTISDTHIYRNNITIKNGRLVVVNSGAGGALVKNIEFSNNHVVCTGNSAIGDILELSADRFPPGLKFNNNTFKGIFTPAFFTQDSAGGNGLEFKGNDSREAHFDSVRNFIKARPGTRVPRVVKEGAVSNN